MTQNMQPLPITVTTDVNAFPSELLETPQPVIAFVGLDCINNLTHKSIWDAFNSNRKSDRAAIRFKLLPSDYDLPVTKPKRQYEWYHPKGILKRNWILKHLHVLPAVVALFLDIDCNDPDWAEKHSQCISTMQAIKNSFQGRHTKLAIVLLQKTTNVVDISSNERLSTLALKCDINPKMIFMLPYNDNLTGYTLRLESAFLEHAQSYYLQSSKLVRAHRDQISSQQGLKIRHQFKLGFYSEMRTDLNAALKHYGNAYDWMEEIRIVDSNCLEIKVVAGFLKYKICKLMFKIGSPRDAIKQFRTHIDKYRTTVGYKELAFEHFAWLSVQYNAFGDLFCEAIKCGLPAIQTQHPGIYYHRSAGYMSKRKDVFQQLYRSSSDQNVTDYSNILYSDYFGIRGSNRTEVASEQQIIAIVQECEKNFNHSAAYCSLLASAMSQFKIYKCPRFRKKIAIEMADEYLKVGDASRALTLYSLMLPEYRSEKWKVIFTQVLLRTLRSAILSASIPDFIACSLELLSKHIQVKHLERIVILENLWKVLQKVPPLTQSQIVPELHVLWENALEKFNSKLICDLDKISELFECTVKFVQDQIQHDDIARINLLIRFASDVPIKVQEFVLIISDTKSIHKIAAHQITDIKSEDVGAIKMWKNDSMILPNNLYKITFVGEKYQFSEDSELRTVRLEIKIGTSQNFVNLLQSFPLQKKSNFRLHNRIDDKLNTTDDCQTCYIIPFFHLKTETCLSHHFMLTNEYFGVTLRVENEFDMKVENVTLIVTVPVHIRNKVFLASDLSTPRQKLLSRFELYIGDIAPKLIKMFNISIISLIDGPIELQQVVRYQVATKHSTSTRSHESNFTKLKTKSCVTLEFIENAVVKSKKTSIVIPCVTDFGFSGQIFSLNKQPLRVAVKHEDFLFQIQLEIKSADIEILDMFLISDYNITVKPYVILCRKVNNFCRQGEKVHDILLLHAEQTTPKWIDRFEYQQRILEKKSIRNVKGSKSPLEQITFTKYNFESIHDLSSETMDATLITDDFKTLSEKQESTSAQNYEQMNEPKTVYNHAIDAFSLVENRKGFLDAKTNINNFNISMSTNLHNQILGVYCIRWRRSGESAENETKFILNSIEIVDAPLNIYCYLEEKMYVKVKFTLMITLRNTSNSALHLKSYLKNADNFMFAGHSQFNICLFAQSNYILEFNLYPLKAGWQNLPEFILEKPTDDHQNNTELKKLVERWVPKKVFILPMAKQI